MELQIITYKDQRILTTQQLADSYETSAKRISQNFNANKERYEEGKHFYCLTGDELQSFLQSANCGTQKVRSLYLWTEKGALMHAKSLNTDKAWSLYESLVDNYFQKRVPLSLTQKVDLSLEYSKEIAGRVEEVNDDLQDFKVTMPLLPVECDDLQLAVRKLGIELLGGKNSAAYQNNSLRGRLYADIGHEIKHKFGVRTYKAIQRKHLERAKNIITNYECPQILLDEIVELSNTICLTN